MSRQPISRSSDNLHGDNEGVNPLYIASLTTLSIGDELYTHSKNRDEADNTSKTLPSNRQTLDSTLKKNRNEPNKIYQNLPDALHSNKESVEENLSKRRASSSVLTITEEQRCPVNCKERIIICLDLSNDMARETLKSKSGEKFSAFSIAKRGIGIFVESKHRINEKHEYALVVLRDVALWFCGFTSDPARIKAVIDDLETHGCDSFDSSSLYDTILENCPLPAISKNPALPPPYVMRTIIVYGRSHCVSKVNRSKSSVRQLESSPYFFTDAIFIHDTDAPKNELEAIFDSLCELDHNGRSYIVSGSRNPAKLYVAFAQMLAHPLQRPVQNNFLSKQLSAE